MHWPPREMEISTRGKSPEREMQKYRESEVPGKAGRGSVSGGHLLGPPREIEKAVRGHSMFSGTQVELVPGQVFHPGLPHLFRRVIAETSKSVKRREGRERERGGEKGLVLSLFLSVRLMHETNLQDIVPHIF